MDQKDYRTGFLQLQGLRGCATKPVWGLFTEDPVMRKALLCYVLDVSGCDLKPGSPGPWWTRSDGSHSNYQQVALGFYFKVSDSPHTDCLQRWCWLSPLWALLWEQSLLGG